MFLILYFRMEEAMKKSGSVVVLVLASTLLAGCANMSMNRHDVGTIGGAVAGGVAGNVLTGGSTLGTVAGAAGGAYLGRTLTK